MNVTSKNVIRACYGKMSFDDLKRQYKYTDDLIYLTLDELKKNDLLAEDYASPFTGMNRREVIRQVSLASMITLPLISNLVAPTAANAASGTLLANGQTCSQDSQCQNGLCRGSECCSGLYTSRTSCTTDDDCCFGGNGTISCGTNANGTTNVCCSTGGCRVTADCCSGRTCISNSCRT